MAETTASPGYTRTDYESLNARYIRPARAVNARRRSLEPPAKRLLNWLAAQPGVAVTGVVMSPASLADVYGFLAEPAYRLGIPLIIVADRALEHVTELEMAEPQVGYAWSLQRLRYLCALDAPPHRWAAASASVALDDSQLAAVSAHDGVVQPRTQAVGSCTLPAVDGQSAASASRRSRMGPPSRSAMTGLRT